MIDIPKLKNPEPMIDHPNSLVSSDFVTEHCIRVDTLYNIAKREGWEDAYIGIKYYVPCRNNGQFVEHSNTFINPFNDMTRVEEINGRKWFTIDVYTLKDDKKNPYIECGCNACYNCPYDDCVNYYDDTDLEDDEEEYEEEIEEEKPVDELKLEYYKKKKSKK